MQDLNKVKEPGLDPLSVDLHHIGLSLENSGKLAQIYHYFLFENNQKVFKQFRKIGSKSIDKMEAHLKVALRFWKDAEDEIKSNVKILDSLISMDNYMIVGTVGQKLKKIIEETYAGENIHRSAKEICQEQPPKSEEKKNKENKGVKKMKVDSSEKKKERIKEQVLELKGIEASESFKTNETFYKNCKRTERTPILKAPVESNLSKRPPEIPKIPSPTTKTSSKPQNPHSEIKNFSLPDQILTKSPSKNPSVSPIFDIFRPILPKNPSFSFSQNKISENTAKIENTNNEIGLIKNEIPENLKIDFESDLKNLPDLKSEPNPKIEQILKNEQNLKLNWSNIQKEQNLEKNYQIEEPEKEKTKLSENRGIFLAKNEEKVVLDKEIESKKIEDKITEKSLENNQDHIPINEIMEVKVDDKKYDGVLTEEKKFEEFEDSQNNPSPKEIETLAQSLLKNSSEGIDDDFSFSQDLLLERKKLSRLSHQIISNNTNMNREVDLKDNQIDQESSTKIEIPSDMKKEGSKSSQSPTKKPLSKIKIKPQGIFGLKERASKWIWPE